VSLRKDLLVIILLSLIFVLILELLGLPRLFSYGKAAGTSAAMYNAAARAYKPDFTLSATPGGNLNQYLPTTPPVTPAFAESFAHTFGIGGSAAETSAAFIYQDDEFRLSVSKSEGFLQLENMKNHALDTPIGSAEASGLAEDFFRRFFFTNYAQISLFADGNGFEAEFVPLLAGIKKNALNTTLYLDRCGNVLNMVYYFYTYENFARCPIMSEYDAFCGLPPSPADETPVTLTGCELVYVYDNSILQPAYLFKGYTKTGRSFSCPVNASIYR